MASEESEVADCIQSRFLWFGLSKLNGAFWLQLLIASDPPAAQLRRVMTKNLWSVRKQQLALRSGSTHATPADGSCFSVAGPGAGQAPPVSILAAARCWPQLA